MEPTGSEKRGRVLDQTVLDSGVERHWNSTTHSKTLSDPLTQKSPVLGDRGYTIYMYVYVCIERGVKDSVSKIIILGTVKTSVSL